MLCPDMETTLKLGVGCPVWGAASTGPGVDRSDAAIETSRIPASMLDRMFRNFTTDTNEVNASILFIWMKGNIRVPLERFGDKCVKL